MFFLFLLLNNVFKLAPVSVVLIELLLACRYVKHAGREERSALGGEGIRIAYGWVGGIDVEVGERTAVEHVIRNELCLLSQSYQLQAGASLEGARRNQLELGWQRNLFHLTVHQHSLSYF